MTLADVEEDKFYVLEIKRIGFTILTIYDETIPLGSIQLDDRDTQTESRVNDIKALIGKWESSRRQEEEKLRARRNERKGKRNDGDTK